MSRLFTNLPNDPAQALALLEAIQPVFVDITTADDSSTGGETQVQHDLGRIPNGYVIVKQPPGLAFTHGIDADTTAADEHFLYIEFSGLISNSLAMTLMVF